MFSTGSRILILLLLSVFVISGCVAIPQATSNLDTGTAPPGHAILFILVTEKPKLPGRNLLTLEIKNLKTVELYSEAVNRIYIPAGDYSFVLPNLPQETNNANTWYSFQAGEVVRMTIQSKKPPIPGINDLEPGIPDDFEPEFKILPISADGMEKASATLQLPLIPVR